MELSGRIDSLDLAHQRFGLMGWTVQWSAATVFRAGSAHSLRKGRSVEVIAQWVPGGAALRAIKITAD